MKKTFIIIVHPDPRIFSGIITDHLNEGFELVGAPFVTDDRMRPMLHQAMCITLGGKKTKKKDVQSIDFKPKFKL